MKSSIMLALSDVLCIIWFRIKLISRDIITMAVLFLSVIVFALMLSSLSTSSEDMSSLPIGVVDYDNTAASEELIRGLQKVETLRIIIESEKKLQKLLLDETILSVFIVEDGYDDKIKSGDLKDIITMYYKKDNKSATILADIVAGEIIYPASFYKGYRYYEQVPFEGQKLSQTDYESYMKELVGGNTDFDFAFHMIYVNDGDNIISEEKLSNSVLYNQFILGILGIVNAFIAMFIISMTVREKEMGVEIRLRISRFTTLKMDIGNLVALFALEGFLAFLFTGLIFYQLKLTDFRLWGSAYLLLLLNSIALGIAMLLIAKIIKRMLLYQVFASAFILLTGGLGFYHMLTGIYQGFADKMVKFIPNSWFIKGFTDIIVYGGEGGYLKEGHRILLIMAVSLILLVSGCDLIQGLNRKTIKSKTFSKS